MVQQLILYSPDPTKQWNNDIVVDYLRFVHNLPLLHPIFFVSLHMIIVRNDEKTFLIFLLILNIW